MGSSLDDLFDEYVWVECPFSSAEVDAATGLNGTIRGDWRRRGFLSRHGLRTETYSPREVAELFVLVGFHGGKKAPLDAAAQQAPSAARSVLLRLLAGESGWHFQGRASDKRELEHLIKHHPKEFDRKLVREIDKEEWEPKSFSRWDGKNWQEFDDLKTMFPDSMSRIPIPVPVVIDHEAVAMLMERQLPRPLYTVRRKLAPDAHVDAGQSLKRRQGDKKR